MLEEWLVYCLQAMNPVMGLVGAVPLAIGVFGLAPVAVGALAGPVSFLQVAIVHALWEGMRRRPRIAGWLDRRASPHWAAVLERRGAFVAALVATTFAGGLPCYVTFRCVGFGFGRIWLAVLLAQTAFGWAATGLCALSLR